MPREKKPNKRLRTASTDSELDNTDSSKGSSTSQPPSPSKKRKKPPGSKGAGSGSGPGGLAPPPTPSGDNIVAGNPFEDDPSGASATVRGLNLLTRRLGRTAAMNNQYGPYGNSYGHHHNMGPGGGPGGGGQYPNNMGANHHNSSNGPSMPQMMYNNPQQTMFPCGICHQQVQDSEDAVVCGGGSNNGCRTWFHRICTGMTTTAYTLLNSELAAEWVCDRCVREKKIPLVRLKAQPITS